MGKLRELRSAVLAALEAEPWPEGLARLEAWPAKLLVGPLYACLLEPSRLTGLRAATAFGAVAARMYSEHPEDARQLMRQLMWRLNEESGNIAWGIPEAFGEILAAEASLAREFHRVLASYIHERDCATGDNFLELCPLRRGVYWALGRLAKARPELVLAARDDLVQALAGDDPQSRGLAAWALGFLLPTAGAPAGVQDGFAPARAALSALAGDGSALELYEDGQLRSVSVGGLAQAALAGR
jgi:hypothetical protein